jgi:tripartite-type tricarboxylate transporter receptor subunit TctC
VLLHEASQKSFQAISATTIASTPDELKRHLVAEIARWKEITTNAGLEQI